MILELCKGVLCVDLGESFQTHIYLQNLASIQPRTSPLNFAGAPLQSEVFEVSPSDGAAQGLCELDAGPLSEVDDRSDVVVLRDQTLALAQ